MSARTDILSIAFVLGACDAGEPGPPVVRTDSAGVEIVHSGQADVDQWQLSPEPMLHIGVVDGPEAEQFTRIIAAAWLSDDRIVGVNFSSPPEVRIFSPGGQHQVSMGGSGAGPGEFSAISLAARLPGDTLLVHDFWSARLTYFDPHGELLRTRSLAEIVGEPATRWGLGDIFEDGTLLVYENQLYPGAAPGRRRAQRSLVRVAPTGELIDTVLVLPDAEYFAGGDGPTAVLHGLRSGWHLDGGRLYVAPGDEFRVDIHDTRGTLLRSLRRDYTRPPVAPQHVEAERERRLAQARTAADTTRIEQALRDLRVAEHFPAHGRRILVNSDGSVWLEHYALPEATSRRWTVFGPDGEYLSEVHVPQNFRIMDIRGDRVLGVWTNEFDVPALRVYELARSIG